MLSSTKRARDEAGDVFFVTQLRQAQRSRLSSSDGIVGTEDRLLRGSSLAPSAYDRGNGHDISYGHSVSLAEQRWWMAASFEPDAKPHGEKRGESQRETRPSVGLSARTMPMDWESQELRHPENGSLRAYSSSMESSSRFERPHDDAFSPAGSVSTRDSTPTQWEQDFPSDWQRFARGRTKSTTSDVLIVPDATGSYTDSPPPTPPPRIVPKTSRYLREMDRHHILQRLQNGEKQAVLALEYQVSRAAICMLNKHRDVVLTREVANPLANHPLKSWPKGERAPQKATTIKARAGRDPPASVHVLATRAAAILKTALLDKTTPSNDFKCYAHRLARVVVEEALAVVPLSDRNVTVKNASAAPVHPVCGIVMETSGSSLLLQLFRELEPRRPTGSIHVTRGLTAETKLPRKLHEQNIFLFDLVMLSPTVTCVAVSSLIARGTSEKRIWLVTVSISDAVASTILTQFPNIQIVTASKDQETKSHKFLVKQFVRNFGYARGHPC